MFNRFLVPRYWLKIWNHEQGCRFQNWQSKLIIKLEKWTQYITFFSCSLTQPQYYGNIATTAAWPLKLTSVKHTCDVRELVSKCQETTGGWFKLWLCTYCCFEGVILKVLSTVSLNTYKVQCSGCFVYMVHTCVHFFFSCRWMQSSGSSRECCLRGNDLHTGTGFMTQWNYLPALGWGGSFPALPCS